MNKKSVNLAAASSSSNVINASFEKGELWSPRYVINKHEQVPEGSDEKELILKLALSKEWCPRLADRQREAELAVLQYQVQGQQHRNPIRGTTTIK